MAKKAVLGRGLSALLPSERYTDADEQEGARGRTPGSDTYGLGERRTAAGTVADISVADIRPNPFQPRQHFDEESLGELADSIRQLGVIQPLTVRIADDGGFELISGERRLRAARIAGLRMIPAYIRDADTEAMLEMAIVENIQRDDLNPIEVAFGFRRLIEECGLTQERVAEKVGKNRSTVANILRLLRLPPLVQAYLRDGRLTSGHARMLVTVEDASVQESLADEIVEKQLSVRDVERMMRERSERKSTTHRDRNGKTPAISREDALQIRSFTDQLRSRYSTQVSIRHRSDGSGKIELSYFSQDELERLLEMLISSER